MLDLGVKLSVTWRSLPFWKPIQKADYDYDKNKANNLAPLNLE